VKKILLAVLFVLLLNTSFTFAEWKLVLNQNSKFYIDNERIKVNNSNIKFWLLVDTKIVQSSDIGSIKSFIAYTELDCKNEKSRVLQRHIYSGKMASGKLLTSDQPNKWKYPLPNTYEEFVYMKVCNKRWRAIFTEK